MMKYKLNKTLIVFVFFMISSIASSRIAPSRSRIKKRIEKQNKSVKLIELSIKRLEKKLGIESKKYLNIINAKKEIDQKIISLNDELSFQNSVLKKQCVRNNQMIAMSLVQNLNEDLSPSDILVKRILMKQLIRTKNEIKRVVQANKISQKKIELLQKRFRNYVETESLVTDLLKDLESRKSILAKSYLNKIKERVSSRKQKRSIKLSSIKKSLLKFVSPLDEYESFDYNKKGVSFNFLGRHNIKSTRAGVVAYLGKLSTYGNVIMIDHGGDTRSVILGQFRPSIKKGQRLKIGQTIGQTRDTLSKSKIAGKLYFEVRKKNKVQNTILLMDRKFLRKNNLISKKS